MVLSDLQLKKLQPKKERYEVADGSGLSIRVSPTGKKSWIYRYMIEGRARRMTLGTYPALSLAEVREKHSQAMQDLQRGLDPGLEKQRATSKRKAAPRVKDLFEEFWEEELQHKKSSHNQRGLFLKDVLPAWSDTKVADITRRDAVLLIDDVRKRAPVTANRLQSLLVRMFNFAAERGIIDHSPLTGMRKKPEKPRERVLKDEEISILWNTLELNSGCAKHYTPEGYSDPYGFFSGIWHAWIFPFTIITNIISLPISFHGALVCLGLNFLQKYKLLAAQILDSSSTTSPSY